MSFNSCQVPLLTYGDKVKLLNILEKENKSPRVHLWFILLGLTCTAGVCGEKLKEQGSNEERRQQNNK